MDRRVDVVLALVVAAVGVVIIVTAQFIGRSPVPDPIGPRGIPTGLGAAFILGGLGLALRRVLRWRSEGTLVEPEGARDDAGVPAGSTRRALSIWGVAAIYVVTLPILGHPVGTPLAVAAMLRLLNFNRRPVLGVPAIIAYPVLFTAVSYTIFAMILGIRLPLGFVRELYLLLTGRS